MKRLLLSAIIFLIYSSSISYSQENMQLKDAVYHRSSLTYIFESNNGKYRQLVNSAIPRIRVPVKLDDNRLIKPIIPQIDDASMSTSGYNAKVIESLQQKKIPNQIIAHWFNRKSDGSFNMNLVLQRGHYDANDDAVLSALSMKRGLSAIDNTAMELVGNSFILVMDVKQVISLDDEYDRTDKKRRSYAKRNKTKYEPIKRIMNGFQGLVEFRLYQINFNDSIAALFYRNLWVDRGDPADVKAQRKAAFDNFNFPLIYQFKTVRNIAGTQLNPGIPFAPIRQASEAELMIKMFESGVEGVIAEVEKVLPKFKIRANLINTNPIEAKIGLKEGLIVDQRYFVYEDKMNKSGKIKSKRKGVVRVKHVVDNREVSSGDSRSTRFYQVAGRSLGTGMVVEQHRGANMGLSAGYNFIGNIKGVEFRLDYNLSSMFAAMSHDGNAITGFKAYLEIGVDVQTYKSNMFKFYDVDNIFEATLSRENDELYESNFGFFRVGLGFSKSIQLSKNVALAPEFGWNYEIAMSSKMTDENGDKVSLDRIVNYNTLSGSTSSDVSENLQYNVHYLIVGAELTINIAYPLQLYGKLDLFAPLTPTLDRDNKLYADKWHDFFNDRSGMTIGGGIRLEF